MDLSVYISELLNDHGTISIPQIGVFKQVRKRGYYNADEGKLYPPYFETDFEQQAVNNDTFVNYLIEKSKVSPASAKYFLDRYVHNIIQQAEIGEALIGRLGWLAKDGDVLTFRPAPAVNTTSAAFGFAPVSVNTDAETETAVPPVEPTTPVNQAPVPPAPVETTPVAPVTFSIEKELTSTPEPEPAAAHVVTEPKANISPLVRQHKPADKPKPVAAAEPIAAPVIPQPPVTQPIEKPVAVNDTYEPAKPFYLKPWFYGAVVLAVVAVGAVILLNQKKTESTVKQTPSKSSPSMDSVVVKKTVVPADTVVIRTLPVKDSVAKTYPLPASTEFAPEVETPQATATHPVVNSNNYKFVLIGGSYGTYEQALAASGRYKAVGISASPFENSRKLFKVALGYFRTYTEGQQAKRELVKQGKVLTWKLYVETIRKK